MVSVWACKWTIQIALNLSLFDMRPRCPVNAFANLPVFLPEGITMQFVQVLLRTLLVSTAIAPVLCGSDFTGVYAKIDRVVVENDTAQVWGVFAAAKPNDRNDYLPPVRGYLYFKLGPNAELTRNEWNDLKQVAGKDEIVAFGTRPFTAQIHKTGEKPANPDVYSMNTGVNRVRGRTDYAPVRSLLEFKD